MQGDAVGAVTHDAEQRFVLVGHSACDPLYVSRTRPDSSGWDVGFGDQGRTSLDIGDAIFATFHEVQIQADGKILACGTVYRMDSAFSIIARFMGDDTARVRISPRVVLEGGHDQATGLMRDSLRVRGFLPASSPWGSSNTNNNLTVSSDVLQRSGEEAVVDWVQVQLRSPVDPAQVMMVRNGLLLRNGRVTDVDGISPLTFPSTATSGYISVHHRNHLPIMTAGPVALGTVALDLDLTVASTSTYGTDARVDLDGIMALRAGDVNGDGRIQCVGEWNDRDKIMRLFSWFNPLATPTGYRPEDLDLDGSVRFTDDAADVRFIFGNVGWSTLSRIIVQQVP